MGFWNLCLLVTVLEVRGFQGAEKYTVHFLTGKVTFLETYLLKVKNSTEAGFSDGLNKKGIQQITKISIDGVSK